ncbi:MAG: VCBS repeat-containing protein [Verrucomicrobia bacterium]|nr:VCBS repeat-containing protein [Verrucomicrobiota bacterium]
MAGDFDGDGHLDLIANEGGSGDVSFFRGLGDGTFTNVSLGATLAPWTWIPTPRSMPTISTMTATSTSSSPPTAGARPTSSPAWPTAASTPTA